MFNDKVGGLLNIQLRKGQGRTQECTDIVPIVTNTTLPSSDIEYFLVDWEARAP